MQQYAFVPALPNGESSGWLTHAPTAATTAAATATSPVRTSYLAHPSLALSTETLRVMRISNTVLVAVMGTLRYPAVREFRLRLVGVPIVTALVQALPGVQKIYVYTSYDGCVWCGAAPLSGIDATYMANRTSQMYSSFCAIFGCSRRDCTPWASLSSRVPRGRERRAAVVDWQGHCVGEEGAEAEGLRRDHQRQRRGGCERGGDGAEGLWQI